MNKIKKTIEGLLFACGDAISLETLAKVTECTVLEVNTLLEELAEEYIREDRGIRLLRIGAGAQLSSAPEIAPELRKLLEPRHARSLSQAAIETLSIIAYRQPVTRREIENIRGVKCDYTVNALTDKGLIQVVGHSDALGHPELLGTTDEFLRVFALQSVDELPHLDSISQEELEKIRMEETPNEEE